MTYLEAHGSTAPSLSRHKNSSMVILSNCFLFFVMNPFFSPVPIQTDMQPVFLMPILLIILHDFFRGKVRIPTEILIFVPLFVMSLITLSSLYYPIKQLSPFVIALIVIGSLRFIPYINAKFITFCMMFHIVGVYLHFFVPETFIPISQNFVRLIKITEIGTRGASGWAAENSFAAAISSCHIVIITCLYKFRLVSHKLYFTMFLLLLGSVLATRSGFAFVCSMPIALTCILTIVNVRNSLYILLSIFLVALIAVNLNSFTGRGYSAFLFIFNTASLELLLTDMSIAARLQGVMMGFVIPLVAPFGIISDTPTEIVADVLRRYKVFYLFPNTNPTLFPSALGNQALIFGAGWFLYPLFIIAFAMRRKINSMVVIATINWMFLFSAGFSSSLPLHLFCFLFVVTLYSQGRKTTE